MQQYAGNCLLLVDVNCVGVYYDFADIVYAEFEEMQVTVVRNFTSCENYFNEEDHFGKVNKTEMLRWRRCQCGAS